MKRDIYPKLEIWKNADWRKPLILKGARQVGKTHLLKSFGKDHYKLCVYFNFEKEPALGELFKGNIEPKKIIEKLSIYSSKVIAPETTLIILDEIQACPEAIKSLKYFNEECNEYHVAAAGSLLGVKIGQSAPFPVGKVNFMDLYPFSFLEFLEGVGSKNFRNYLEQIKECEPIETAFHEQLQDLLRLYFYIGGMPEAIVTYKENKDMKAVRRVQNEILSGYENDFSKYTSPSDAIKIGAIWESIPVQLAKENKKFKYAEVSKNARAREYSEALKWLHDAGLIIKSYRIEKANLPLDGYKDEDSFKLYLLDTGLLAAKLKLTQRTILVGNTLFQHFNGAFTENYVAQELLCNGFSSLYYWAHSNQAEVDFIVDYKEEIFPLEVKAGINGKSASLRAYNEKFKPSASAITTLRNLKMDNGLCNFPLYAVNRFPELLSKNKNPPEQLELKGI